MSEKLCFPVLLQLGPEFGFEYLFHVFVSDTNIFAVALDEWVLSSSPGCLEIVMIQTACLSDPTNSKHGNAAQHVEAPYNNNLVCAVQQVGTIQS